MRLKAWFADKFTGPYPMIGDVVLKCETRGCMAETEILIAVGEITRIYDQRENSPHAQSMEVAACRDPLGDYPDFTVLVPRLHHVINRTWKESV